jgi:exodeoxyribonuclease VII small subunit
MMKAKKDVKNSLESSLKRLEEIVEILERGETPLDDAVMLYEEGVQISKACAEKLKAAELKIKKISKDIDGQFTVNEIDEE